MGESLEVIMSGRSRRETEEPQNQVTPGGVDRVETLSELLTCYICTDRLRDASLCPHCSKLGCYNCIRRWVTNNRANCPHCRAPLTANSLIRVPLFDEVRHELEQLPASQLDGSTKTKESTCSQHNEKLSVYCETCHLCICHKCALWESTHHSHSFKPIEVLYKRQKEKFMTELNKLRERMKEVLNQVQTVEKKMEGVKSSKVKVRRDLAHTMDKILERLEEQYISKQQKLGDARHKLKSQAMQITRATRELEAKISNGSMSCLLNERGEMREDVLQNLRELQSIEAEPVPSISEFVNEVVPSYQTGVFKIHPFRELQREGEEIYSKPLQMCGTVWKLKVYPNGHREDTGVYLSVFVELTEGYDRTSKYQYSIEMLYGCSNKHPSRNYKREYASDFADGECWGYRKFYELRKLEDEGFLRDNTLVLRFSVRSPTHHQKCRDLSSHIRRLEHKMESLQKELQASKENKPSPVASPRLDVPPAGPTHSPSPVASPAHTPPRSRSSHQHSNSEPIPQANMEQERRRERQRERERERERERVKERERGYRERRGRPHMYMSQQPLPTHSQHLGSPNKRSYLSQSRHSDSHLMGLEPGQQLPFHPHHHQPSAEGPRHRRRSAEHAVGHPLDNPMPSSASFSHPFPHARGPSQSREHLHLRQDSFGSSTEEPHHMEELGMQPLVGGANSRWPKERRAPRFEEMSGDEGGCSQPRSWDPISHMDIQIRIEDEGETAFSSASTLTGTSQPHGPHPHPPPLGQPRSQEHFAEEEDHMRLMDMLGGPLSSQHPYFDPYDQENAGPPQAKSEGPPHTYGLSQPTVSKRWQSSVPDLSILTGTTSASNLAHSQFLSQSVLEVQHHTHRGEPVGGRYTDTKVFQAATSRPTSQSYGYLNRMPSEPRLNEGVLHPGLQRTLLAKLREEEGEHSPNSHRRRQRAMTSQQPPKKCYQGARRARTKESGSPSSRPRGTQTPRRPSHEENSTSVGKQPSPAHSPTHNSQSPGSNPELTPTNNPAPPSSPPPLDKPAAVIPAAGNQLLGVAGRSGSNTSLSNLDLI